MFLKKLFTKQLKEIPLFWVNFNYILFKDKGKENSCMAHIHPLLKDDKHIQDTLKELIDYIRDNYNMEDI